ncbi:TPA: hypothetical protein ACTYTR_003827 [Klebsiella michiganensis]|uniref:hypothetical protein n=1 Tax=Klebsiella michiganensis TaxID=1134687 RepID=UPI0012B9F070|nr:hypothetical protein [Klebsiella michiganensis]ELO7623700.1 hypothetical protein [Klebsiella michiganensis]QWA87604.1 hypothetical protein KLH67_15550 [Klebsiella michiganensis]HDX8758168.1 hypothetical protein [Klebsiella michiganensis]
MQEFKGTPGPWHVSNEGCMLIRDDAGLSIVAKYVGYTNDEEELANARLISAAPELLEALLLIMGGDFYMPKESADVARLAIAKALGK